MSQIPARNHSNLAVPVALTVAVAPGDTTLSVGSTADYDDPPFILGIDRGTVDEEICLCTAKTANTFTVTRGYDGTTAKAHELSAPVEHVTAAIDYREPNQHIFPPAGTNDWHIQTERFGREGPLTVLTGTGRMPFLVPVTLVGVSAVVDTAPQGASITLELRLNKTTTIATLSIPAGANTSGEVLPSQVSLNANDSLTVNITQIGSTTAGSDLTVSVRYRVT